MDYRRIRFEDVSRAHARQPAGRFGAGIVRWYDPRSEPVSDLWGCVVSTGPGYRGTRAEDATGPRKSGGKKKYLATASRLSPSLLRQ